MTYQPPHDRDDPSLSIEDLCKPISAHRMPVSALAVVAWSEDQHMKALQVQRSADASAFAFRVRKQRAKK